MCLQTNLMDSHTGTDTDIATHTEKRFSFLATCACNICSVCACAGAFASMADRYVSRQAFRIIFLCILWYIVSSSNNVIGKILLSEFPYPMTVTMVHLLSITIYSGPFFNLWGVRKFVDISWRYYFTFIVPLALGKFLASVFSHVSIWKVPVSYAHTGNSPPINHKLIPYVVIFSFFLSFF